MLTVAETPLFIRQAAKLLDEDEKAEVIDFLASNPTAGDLVPGGAGVRKVRIPASGRGKRGGARVIYYFHDDRIPLYALMIYAKNQKEDLSPDGRKAVARLVAAIRASARNPE